LVAAIKILVFSKSLSFHLFGGAVEGGGGGGGGEEEEERV
jgi:hypothetical protein